MTNGFLIVGDYDADGATSTALMVRALGAMGAKQVSYLVPNRFEDGYGLSPAIVDAARSFQPQVLVTVDNGISSLDGCLRSSVAFVCSSPITICRVLNCLPRTLS